MGLGWAPVTDRDALIARINRAAEAGLIGEVDRNIRVTNVKHAQSDIELQLIARDLDQLEGSLQPAAAWSGPPSTSPVPVAGQPDPGRSGAQRPGTTPNAGKAVAGIVGCVVVIVVLVTVAIIGIVAFVTVRGAASDGAESGVVEDSGVVSTYALDERGITDFLAAYRERFGTGKAAELVMYDDYAVVMVPVEGKARAAGWIYRDGEWRESGGVRATFPGSQPVGVGRIDVPALVANIERARATLGVEKISTTYVVVHHYSADEPPEVDIHVSNEYGESGYLATRPGGAVVRAFPYDS